MTILGAGEILLLFISAVMVAFCLFALIIQPNKEHNKTEVYHSITTKMGDRVYSETKVFKGSFTDETRKDQAVFNTELHTQNSRFIPPSHNSYVVSDIKNGLISEAVQKISYENNLYSVTERKGYKLGNQKGNQIDGIYEVV